MSKSGYTCVRYIFCYLNLILWLCGCGLVGVGLWLRLGSPSPYLASPHLTHSALSADSLLIAVGVTLFVIAFFACCGAWFQSRCMLITYFSLVIVMFVIEFGLATVAFVYRESISEDLKISLKEGIRLHYSTDDENGLADIWDGLQTRFNCCGVDNYEDWYDIEAWPGKKMVPASCCLPKFNGTSDCWREGNQSKWFEKGCSDEVLMWFVSQLHIVGVVGLVVSFIQLFGLISAMLLFCTVRHKRARDPQRGKYTAYTPSI